MGDEGKGITTDYLCSEAPSEKRTMVVRFSGGPQAGHTVMIGSKKHIHSSYPSGTLRGFKGFISHHCIVNPVLLNNEQDKLTAMDIHPELYIHPLAILSTPFDILINRKSRLTMRDGTCGLGIGATMNRHLHSKYKLYVTDMVSPSEDFLRSKLIAIHSYYSLRLDEKRRDQLIDEYITSIRGLLFQLVDYEVLKKMGIKNFIFEGSQGIMLDMDHGTIPNVTYANTTSKNAMEICKILGIGKDDIDTFYVTRAYLTRHGNGWMPKSIGDIELINTSEEINVDREYQGKFRTQKLDSDLIMQAMLIDKLYNESKNINLVVTCIDQYPDYTGEEIDAVPVSFKSTYHSTSPYSKNIVKLE